MTIDLVRAATLARKIKELQAEEEDIKEAIENLKAKEAELLGGVETEKIVGDNDNGFLKVTVYQSKTFNEEYGKKNAPELWELYAEEKKVLTSARAKDKLSGDDYKLFQKPSAKLSVKVEVISE